VRRAIDYTLDWVAAIVLSGKKNERAARSGFKSESEQKVATTMADLRAGITVLFHAEDAEER
jgi:hypothetical protein